MSATAPDATAPKANEATEPSPLQVVASAGGVVAKVGGSAIWAAGSYISNYALGDVRRRDGAALEQSAQPANPAEADDGTVRGLGSTEVLRIANALDGIFNTVESGGATKLRQPEVPRLVVVGGRARRESNQRGAPLKGGLGSEHALERAPLHAQNRRASHRSSTA